MVDKKIDVRHVNNGVIVEEKLRKQNKTFFEILKYCSIPDYLTHFIITVIERFKFN